MTREPDESLRVEYLEKEREKYRKDLESCRKKTINDGKGAPDGVGGALKRRADSLVSEFVQCILWTTV